MTSCQDWTASHVNSTRLNGILLGLVFYKYIKKLLEKKTFNEYTNKGLIKFTPKPSNPEQITNYGPITLLNDPYKILDKVMALHIMHILQKIIHPKQLGFIIWHFILDNVNFVVRKKGMHSMPWP